jgi:6-phosphogluconolactonase (cycloisomerase 2 family)
LSPDGKFLYASNRLKADGIAIFSVNQETGLLTKVGYQLTGIHPRNFVMTPDGKFLLVACRDSNLVQIFSRDKETGLLAKVGYQLTGIHPRNFVITPDGKFLLVACRDSNLIQIFSRDEKSGLLMDTGKRIETSKPVCLKFI